MSKTDQWAVATLIVLITIYLTTWIIGLATHKLPWLISMINLLTGLSLIIFWAQKEIRITQHMIETREIMVLGFEFLSLAFAVYAMINNRWDGFIKLPLYIIFGIHLLALVLLLVFMITFKLNKLF